MSPQSKIPSKCTPELRCQCRHNWNIRRKCPWTSPKIAKYFASVVMADSYKPQFCLSLSFSIKCLPNRTSPQRKNKDLLVGVGSTEPCCLVPRKQKSYPRMIGHYLASPAAKLEDWLKKLEPSCLGRAIRKGQLRSAERLAGGWLILSLAGLAQLPSPSTWPITQVAPNILRRLRCYPHRYEKKWLGTNKINNKGSLKRIDKLNRLDVLGSFGKAETGAEDQQHHFWGAIPP